MQTLEAHIARHATRTPDKPALICGPDRCSYAALHARIEVRASELSSLLPHGGSPASVVPLRAASTIDFLVTYFALHRLGLAAAPLERDLPEESFRSIAAALTAHRCPAGTADVLYTTGTTGRSKGVMVSHSALLADAENLIAGQGFREDTIFVVNGPLNHIGSLSKVWPVMLLGGTVVIVDGLKDLEAFFGAFETERAGTGPTPTLAGGSPTLPERRYATFLVPASLRILLQLAPDRLAALSDRLDFLETGAAAIAQADMGRLCSLLPLTRLYNTYASTETGIIATHNWNNINPQAQSPHLPQSSHQPQSPQPPHQPQPPQSPQSSQSSHQPQPLLPGCLGHPMPHSSVHITKDGLIACSGVTLMTGYLGEPERTTSVLRDGILYTNDRGRIDDQGRLHLLGRDDDVINVGGYKVAPTEVEDAAMSHPSVADCLCIATDHPITGKALKLLVVLNDGFALDKRALARHLRDRLESFKVPMNYEQTTKIARTFNGKPDRRHYQP